MGTTGRYLIQATLVLEFDDYDTVTSISFEEDMGSHISRIDLVMPETPIIHAGFCHGRYWVGDKMCSDVLEAYTYAASLDRKE